MAEARRYSDVLSAVDTDAPRCIRRHACAPCTYVYSGTMSCIVHLGCPGHPNTKEGLSNAV